MMVINSSSTWTPAWSEAMAEVAEHQYAYADDLAAGNIRAAATLYESALLLDFYNQLTIPPHVLGSINIRTDLHRHRTGRILSLAIRTQRQDSFASFEILVSTRFANRLDRHLEKYRPHLPAGKTECLFLCRRRGAGKAAIPAVDAFIVLQINASEESVERRMRVCPILYPRRSLQ